MKECANSSSPSELIHLSWYQGDVSDSVDRVLFLLKCFSSSTWFSAANWFLSVCCILRQSSQYGCTEYVSSSEHKFSQEDPDGRGKRCANVLRWDRRRFLQICKMPCHLRYPTYHNWQQKPSSLHTIACRCARKVSFRRKLTDASLTASCSLFSEVSKQPEEQQLQYLSKSASAEEILLFVRSASKKGN